MQLDEPRCFQRKCKHYEGMKQMVEGDPMSQDHFCPAFPKGIPTTISYGKNLHSKPFQKQKGNIVYEKETT